MTKSPVAGDAIAIPPAGRYRIDPERSAVTFTTRHLFGLGAVHGTLALRDGRVHIADPVIGSSAEARVASASFRSGNETRDAAVLSLRLLDAQRYPSVAFTSTELVHVAGQWLLHGELEVRTTARLVEVRIITLSVEEGQAGPTLHATAQLSVDRYEFGLTAYRGLAARRLTVDLDIVAVKERS